MNFEELGNLVINNSATEEQKIEYFKRVDFLKNLIEKAREGEVPNDFLYYGD